MRRTPAIIAASLLLAVPVGARASSTVAPPVLPAPDTWIPTAGGTVRVLDKQKADSRAIPLKVGGTATFETLSITLRACDAHAPDVPQDSAAHLTVTDSRAGEPGFQGWMFASEPFAAMLQSPVYGLRVIGCDPPTPAAVAAAMPAPPVANPDEGTAGAAPPAATAAPGAPQPADVPPPTDMPPPPAGQDLGDGDGSGANAGTGQ